MTVEKNKKKKFNFTVLNVFEKLMINPFVDCSHSSIRILF